MGALCDWFSALGLAEQIAVAGLALVTLLGLPAAIYGYRDLLRDAWRAVFPRDRLVAPPSDTPEPPLATRGPRILPLELDRDVIGRDAELAELRCHLTAVGKPGLRGVVLEGQGGLGKTTLAIHYARTHDDDYPGGVFWAVAGDPLALAQDLTALAPSLGIDIGGLTPIQAGKAILAEIARREGRWLFIYDNVENHAAIAGRAPGGDAHLIVTTRSAGGWPGFRRMRPGTLPSAAPGDSGPRLLMDEAQRYEDPEGARALAEALGGLPLALVVAGTLIRGLDEPYAVWQQRFGEIIAAAPPSEDYADSVIGAVKLSYDRLSDDAKLVVDLFAWWAPDGLDAALITDAPSGDWWEAGLTDIPGPTRALARDPARVRSAIGELVARSLLVREGQGHALHRMSAAALRALQSQRSDAGTAAASAALVLALLPGGDKSPSYSPQWPLYRRLTPHVRALWATGAAPTTLAMATLLNNSSIYLGEIADYAGSLTFARASRDLKLARLPEEHREVAVAHAS